MPQDGDNLAADTGAAEIGKGSPDEKAKLPLVALDDDLAAAAS